ncbi:MAG: hypothetical protein RL761_193 [Pseudomonadota bacterium]|jgi:hypothetical protein
MNLYKNLNVLLVALVALTLSTSSLAKSDSTKQTAGLDKQFAKADTENTGRISKKQAFKAKMYEVDRYFFDMDANGDGWLTLEELKTWKSNPVRNAPRPRGDKLDRFVPGDQNRLNTTPQ